MGQIVETKINRFDGGIENDPRDSRENSCRVVSNFDLTNPHKMTPYRSSEDGDGGASTSQKQNFALALRTGTTYGLYALGVVSGTGRAEVLYKDLTTGATGDLDDNGWNSPTYGQSSTGATNFNLFVFYHKTGFIYGARSGSQIWRFDPTNINTWADSHQALTYTNIAQGLVHSKDDILYIPYDNKIAKNDNGSWTVTALTLPTHFYITSISEYGDYLAIACAPLSGFGNSRVFLWDRNESVTTLSESIDWGSGVLQILEQVDGELIGISRHSNVANFVDKVIFRKLVGNVAVKFTEIRGGINTTQLLIKKQKINNRLYFMMLVELGGATRDGVWSIGKNVTGEWVLTNERTSNNNTALDTSDAIREFYLLDDYMFISYQDGGTFALSKTDNAVLYSHNSDYESKKFNVGDASLYKDLLEVTVTTEPLPSSGSPSVILAYRVDEDTSWTTIFTNTTATSISRTAVASLPKAYKEIQFRIRVTGGAGAGVEPTGLMFKEEIVGTKYDTT